MASPHPSTCKPHKCPILISHFFSSTLLLAEFFLCWDMKHQSSEAPETPSSRLTSEGQLLLKVSEFAQSCPTLCDPVDCSPPGSSIHGIIQARILEWVAIFFSRGFSWPRDRTKVSCITGRCFNLWATYKFSTFVINIWGSPPKKTLIWSFSWPLIHMSWGLWRLFLWEMQTHSYRFTECSLWKGS